MRRHTISFINASKGIWFAVLTQPNLRVHFVIASLVIFAASYFNISISELVALVLTISVVVIAEMVNTSLEFMSDAITLEKNDNIRYAKDVSAGAVLLSAIFAIFIGLMIFIPKFL